MKNILVQGIVTLSTVLTSLFNFEWSILTIPFAMENRSKSTMNESSRHRCKCSSYSKSVNMKISLQKTKTMAFKAKCPSRTKIVLDNKRIEQVSLLRCLGCDITYDVGYDVEHKLAKFQLILVQFVDGYRGNEGKKLD